MTVTLELNPELENHLVAQAAEHGLSLEAYLLSIIETRVIHPKPRTRHWKSSKRRWLSSAGTDHIPVLAPKALTRESIYGSGPLSPIAVPPTEEQFERELMRAGILDEVQPPPRTSKPGRDRKPIEVKGKPLSETIIEDRR